MPWQNMNTFETYKTMNTDITMEKKGKTRLSPLSDLLGACGPKTNGLLKQLTL